MQMPDELLCPYCNHILQNFTLPHFTSECCNRIVSASEVTEYKLSFSRVSDIQKKNLGLEGDNSRPPGVPIYEGSRPHSKWTWVFVDMSFFYVRLIPKAISIEDNNREWGLALATQFTSVIEAHRFADSVDLFMDAIEKGILEKAQEVKDEN